jgi:pimeloyl-ACP methyl ester carboxylesterase
LLTDRVDLHTHVEDIVNVITWEGLDEVTLVGHSYGGRVAAGVVEELAGRIASVVLIDSPLTESGEQLARPGSTRAAEIARARLTGRFGLPPPSASEFGVMAEEDRRWVDEKTTDHPIGVWSDRLHLTGAMDRVPRKLYIWASRSQFPDRRPEAEALRARKDWDVQEMPCGHDVMVDMPDELVDILIAIGARGASPTEGELNGVEG